MSLQNERNVRGRSQTQSRSASWNVNVQKGAPESGRSRKPNRTTQDHVKTRIVCNVEGCERRGEREKRRTSQTWVTVGGPHTHEYKGCLHQSGGATDERSQQKRHKGHLTATLSQPRAHTEKDRKRVHVRSRQHESVTATTNSSYCQEGNTEGCRGKEKRRKEKKERREYESAYLAEVLLLR